MKQFDNLTLPTEGNPIRATLASPDLSTSNPAALSPPFLGGSNNWDLYLANFALSKPKWYSVAMNIEIY